MGEAELRDRLGIPADAERVLVFGETSHWDPNWLFTTEQYYRWRIRRILDEVITVLDEEPRRVFAIESLYFLQMYWERNPERRDDLRRLINEGRLRLTGTGITTPDVTLPDTEAILRDYLLGQEWLRAQGITVEPDLAYLPDDFGYSPALPTLLRSLGFSLAGITRIDGMYFVGTDMRRRSSFPLKGSSAEQLLREHKTQDFIWRAPDGAEVLCHWNAFTYFQGDLLAHKGVIRWMGTSFGVPWRTRRHVARRVRSFVRSLSPQAPTPYMFCPIGCDFNGPIRGLVTLLDRYNEESYPDTGIFVVNAGMDDYLRLVEAHRDKLPTIDFEPNPYWMGFYSSRPTAKRSCNRIARKLVLAERLEAVRQVEESAQGRKAAPSPVREETAEAWDILVLSNHHDYITGTSPDRVWKKEQQPWLARAEELADLALEDVGRRLAVPAQPGPAALPDWTLDSGHLVVRTPHYRVEVAEEAGGCLVSWADSAGHELLTGPGNDLVGYKGSGGLWRMGHEYRGGRFKQRWLASALPAHIEAAVRDQVLQVKVTSQLAGADFVRWLWFRADSPVIRMAVEGAARRRSTITVRFPTRLATDRIVMDVPGGIADRPMVKLYRPTFWPGRTFAHVRDGARGDGLAAFLGGPMAVTLKPEGVVEWVAQRNAPKEVAYRVLPLLSHPASGLTDEATRFTYAVWHTAGGDWRDNHLEAAARRVLHRTWHNPSEPDLDYLADSQWETSHPDVFVTAFKPAARGDGYIVRLACHAPAGTRVHLTVPAASIRRATLCDARERDLSPLPVAAGRAELTVTGAIATVRIHFATE